MKSGAYPASTMKPKYQTRKKIVAGTTNDFFLRTSSWNSGDRSAATQSMSVVAISPPLKGPPGATCPSPDAEKHLDQLTGRALRRTVGWARRTAPLGVHGASAGHKENCR